MENSEKNSSFLVQATILAIAGLLVRILGFLYRIPMQNILEDEGTGIYGQAFNIYLLFLIISSAGLPAAISKMVSARVALNQHENAYKVFKVAFVLATITGFAGMATLFFGANFFANMLESALVVKSIQALAPTVFIVALLSVFRGYFQGLGNAMPTAASQVIEQIFNAFFSIFLAYILIDEGFEIAAAGGTAASGIGAFFGLIVIVSIFYMSKKYNKNFGKNSNDKKKRERTRRIALEIIFTAVPIVAGTAIFSITNIIDTQMIMSILANIGMTEREALRLFGQLNGKYVVITTLPVAIATAIATAVIPSISHSVAIGNKLDTKNKINAALRISMIISVPAAFGIGVLAHPILVFLFPNNYEGAILLQVGSVSVLFLALNQVSTGMLQGMNKLSIPIFAAFCGVIFKIPLNYVLISIPEINVLGAVISTTVCYFVAATINTFFVARVSAIKIDFVGTFIKPITSSVAMALTCYIAYNLVFLILSNNTVAVLIAIAIGIVVYFCAMIFIDGITYKDFEMLPNGIKIAKKLGIKEY